MGGQGRRAIHVHNGWTKSILIHLEEPTEACRILTEAGGCNRFLEISCPLLNATPLADVRPYSIQSNFIPCR